MPEPGRVNVLGIVALVVAAVGFVLACIPFVQVAGLVLLPVALVLAIVALFLNGRKWPAIAGLIVSVLGAIVGTVVLAVVTFSVFGQFVDSGVIPRDRGAARGGVLAGADRGRRRSDDEPDGGARVRRHDGVGRRGHDDRLRAGAVHAVGARGGRRPGGRPGLHADDHERLDRERPAGGLLHALSGGIEATRIIDVGAEGGQVGIPPTTAVLPGESITWQEAWSVADSASLTMQTAPSFGYESVVFTNVP